jgi:phage terminase large subunit GpA-like protein
MVRGVGAESAPLLARVKKERDRRGKALPHSKRFYNFATSVLKMALYRNVVKSDPQERGYVSFPKDLPDEYFRQLTAERRVPVKRKDGFVDWKWVKDENQANEALDMMLQAEAAAIKLGLRTLPDTHWDKLEAERCTPVPDEQMDLEDMMLTPQTRSSAQPPRRTRRRRGMISEGLT